MSIAILSHRNFPSTPGGAELQLYLIAKELYDISQCKIHWYSNDKQVLSDEILYHDCSDISWIGILRELKSNNVKKIIFRTNHSNNIKIWIAGLLSGSKIIYMFASDGHTDFWYNTVKSRNLKSIFSNLITDIIHRIIISRASLLSAQNVNQWMKLSKFRPKLKLVPNAIYYQKRRIQKSSKTQICWIGSIKIQKQPGIFFNLATRLTDLEFVMAGRNAEFTLPLNLSNFTYLGELTLDGVYNLLAESHILINTSENGIEGFPNVFLQAWQMGCFVISLNTNPNGILNNKLGLHCNGDVVLLEENLLQLASNMQSIKPNEIIETFNQKFSNNDLIDFAQELWHL